MKKMGDDRLAGSFGKAVGFDGSKHIIILLIQ